MKKNICRLIIIQLSVLTVLSFSQNQTMTVNSNDNGNATVSAKGTTTLILPVKKWCRYSVMASGKEPVAVSIADKRSGIIRSDGEAGVRNGRIDMFFDIGEYKIIVNGTAKASSMASITSVPFVSLPDCKLLRLFPLRENQLTLDDFQQVNFWFEVHSDTTVYIEAAGRNLEDLRLWRDGEWLMESDNRSFTSKTEPQKPLKCIALSTKIPAGTYMVSAYGGTGYQWSTQSSAHPLTLQWGIERESGNIINSCTISKKGYVLRLLDKSISQIVVQQTDKKKKNLYMETGDFSDNFSYQSIRGYDSIHSKSVAGRILINNPGGDNSYIKISGEPGQMFTLQTMSSSQTEFEKKSEYWAGSLHTGNYEDQIGASGFIIDSEDNRAVAVNCDTLSSDRRIARRFNILDNINMYIWVDNDGDYSVDPGNTDMKWRVYRYFYSAPQNFKIPDFRDRSGNVKLNRGLYCVQLEPVKKGVATLFICKSSLFGSAISAARSLLNTPDSAKQWDKPRPSVQFPLIKTGDTVRYSFIINNQSPEKSVRFLRKYPLDPDIPFGFWCKSLQKIAVSVKLQGSRNVSVTDVDNKEYGFAVNGKKYDKSTLLGAGTYSFVFENTAPEERQIFLKSVSPERLPSSPMQSYPDETIAAIPKFTVLDAGSSAFTDLKRNSSAIYALSVLEPALYKIETTGRMATGISIRDRFGNYKISEQQNGIGRNAMVTAYLTGGQYLLTVSSIDQSAGHLGVSVMKSTLADGGIVQPDFDNRTTVPQFSGVQYNINVKKTGNYIIENSGLAGNFPFRIEDMNGWPLMPVINESPFNGNIDQGDYKIISMPSPQESRRIARVKPVLAAVKLKGKGPHKLIVNEIHSSIWTEAKNKTGKTAEKTEPAIFTFELPAPVSGRFSVPDGFNAILYRNGADTAMRAVKSRQTVNLDMGKYRLQLTPKKNGNYIPYDVSFTTSDLIPGLSRTINKKQTVRVSVGTNSIVEFVSQGMLDVSAVLLDSTAKNVIASNDDSYSDWNFGISKMLKPGRYFLKIESAEGGFTSTTVFMRSLTDTVLQSAAVAVNEPLNLQFNLNRHIGILEIGAGEKGDIIAASAKGKSRIGCSIERKVDKNWAVVASRQGMSPFVSIPREKSAIYRLRVWSEDNVDENIALSYVAADAKFTSWKNAKSGLSGKTIDLGNEHCAWFKLDLENQAPGHFYVKPDKNTLQSAGISMAIDTSFTVEQSSWFESSEQYAWVEYHFDNDGRFDVSSETVVLGEYQQLSVNFVGSRPRIFETKTDDNSVGFLLAESDGRNPFAAVMTKGKELVSPVSIRGISIDQSLWSRGGICAAAVLPDDINRVVVWNPLLSQDGTQPSAKLTWYNLPRINAGQENAGVSSWIAAKQSVRFTRLQKGSARIIIPAGNAIVFVHNNGNRELEFISGTDPSVKDIKTDGGELYLIGLRDGAAFDVAFYIDNLQKEKKSLHVEGNMQHEFQSMTEGTLRIPLDIKDGRMSIYFSGAVQNAGWVSSQGMLTENIGDGAKVGPGGFVNVNFSVGWSRVSFCKGNSPQEVILCKWGMPVPVASEQGAYRIKQSSAVRLADKANWFAIDISDTVHVNISTPQSMAAILLRNGKPADFEESHAAFNWDIPLAPGSYVLGIRPVNGISCDGAMLDILMRSIEMVTERKPFNGNLTPGESRLIAFDITSKAQYGIGLRMNKETVLASLYSPDGRLISQGRQQFLKLDKGRYYLRLYVPLDAEGTNCTVYLFGQEPPPNVPPENLVRWIVSGADGERPHVVNDNSDDDTDRPPVWMNLIRSSDNENSEMTEDNSGEENDEGVSEDTNEEYPDVEQSDESDDGEGDNGSEALEY